MINYTFLSCADSYGILKEINVCPAILPSSAATTGKVLVWYADTKNDNLFHIKAESGFVKQSDLSTTLSYYVKHSSFSSTLKDYVDKATADATYLDKVTAETTYVSKATADATYMNRATANADDEHRQIHGQKHLSKLASNTKYHSQAMNDLREKHSANYRQKYKRRLLR